MKNILEAASPELEYLFFLSFNIRLYDKNSESDFFFLHQNQNIFFSNIGNQNIFLEKNHNSSLEAASPGHNLDHEIEFKVLHERF
jgi:hypothetical protein